MPVNGIFGSDMAGELMQTPAANRLHIGFFGRRNSGKSSLLNALVGQDVVIVSDVAGTTTDPVRKNMEIHGLGACTLVDTAGFDDIGSLGLARVEKTKDALKDIDLAVMVFSGAEKDEIAWWQMMKERTTCIPVVAKSDLPDRVAVASAVEAAIGEEPSLVSSVTNEGIEAFRSRLIRSMPPDFEAPSITGTLIHKDDVVLLVMPQDIQAPKGRLILPQVQTIRDLLDNHAVVMSCTTTELDRALTALREPPALIITDSQIFPEVFAKKPEKSALTSFSILMAAYKGDIEAYRDGALAIRHLSEDSHVLIAEACSHAPLEEDIGRVKIPNILRNRYGAGLSVSIVSGRDFPQDLSEYDLIIQCGACMFNRRHVLERIAQAQSQKVPITNYGVALAELNKILDFVVLP